MPNLSQAEILETVSLILAASNDPLRMVEIEDRLHRLGYDLKDGEILQALEHGPFRRIGQRWEFFSDSNS